MQTKCKNFPSGYTNNCTVRFKKLAYAFSYVILTNFFTDKNTDY